MSKRKGRAKCALAKPPVHPSVRYAVETLERRLLLSQLQTQLILPSDVSRNTAATFYVEYSNNGTVSMPAPVLMLESSNAADKPLLTLDSSLATSGLTTSTLPNGYSNTVEILGSGKTPGLLAPGESVVVPVYYAGMEQPWNTSETSFQFNLMVFTSTDTASVNWSSLKSALQPSGISTAAWNTIYANLTTSLGSTWGTYVQALDSEASYLGQLGENVTNVGELWAFAMQQADNALSPVGPYLASATDDALSMPGSLSLSFSRVFAEPIAGRDTMGPLGMGWSTPWQTSASVAANGAVTITEVGGAQRVFQLEGSSYVSQPGDTGTLTPDGNGGYLLTEADGTATDFNPNGTLNYIQDTDGNTITAGYTSGELTTLTASSGQSLTISYNAHGLISSVADSEGRTTTYAYDATNTYLLSVTGYNGQTTSYTYNTTGGSPAQNALTSITSPGGTQQNFTYDTQGRLAGTSENGGLQPLTFAYSQGQVSVTDGAGDVSNLFFNEQGLVVKSVDPLGNATLFTYDADDNLIAVTNAAGQSETYSYDSAGEVVSSTDFLGNTTSFTYSGSFNDLASMTDANGNTTGYSYDSSGDLLTTTYANGSSSSSTFNPEGEATSFLNANGQPIGYTYNSAGQVLTEQLSDGTSYTYTYDSHGNLLTATHATGTTSFTYNPTTELLTEVTYPNGTSLTFTYNAAGQRTKMVDQTGFTVNYTYDSLGRLTGLTDSNGNPIAAYTYDAAGRLSEETNGNGSYTTYTYDADGNVLSLVNFALGGAVNSSFTFTYNSLGLATTETTIDGAWTYTYNADGELTGAVFASTNVSVPSQNELFNYDAMGNRTSTVINGVTTTYVTNDMNEYTSVGGVPYTYDADGNLTSDGVNTYTYDSLNQLTGVSGPSGTTTYFYNAVGEQIASTTNGQTTQNLIDPTGLGNVVGTYTGSGSLIADYTYGLGLVSQVTPTSKNYYQFDALGSTADTTNSGGAVVDSYNYQPFGGILASTQTMTNPFQFVGAAGVMSAASGLDAMRARFYQIATGRFTSKDPFGVLGGNVNLFVYAHNNPNQRTDASGLINWAEVGTAVGVGVVLGAGVFFAPEILGTALLLSGDESVLALLASPTVVAFLGAHPDEVAILGNTVAGKLFDAATGSEGPPPQTTEDFVADLTFDALFNPAALVNKAIEVATPEPTGGTAGAASTVTAEAVPQYSFVVGPEIVECTGDSVAEAYGAYYSHVYSYGPDLDNFGHYSSSAQSQTTIHGDNNSVGSASANASGEVAVVGNQLGIAGGASSVTSSGGCLAVAATYIGGEGTLGFVLTNAASVTVAGTCTATGNYESWLAIYGSTSGLVDYSGASAYSSVPLDTTLQLLPGTYWVEADIDSSVAGANPTGATTLNVTLTIGAADPNLIPEALSAVPFTIQSNPPSASAPPSATVNENGSLLFAGALNVADIDGDGTPESLILASTNGTFALGSTLGLTVVSGSNDSSALTVTGPLDNLNAALNDLVFTPAANASGSGSLGISIDNPGNDLTASAAVAITINPLAPSAPVITTNPASQSVPTGQTVTFTAAAIGTPTPTIQWQLSTNAGKTFTNISGATSTTFSFTTTSSQSGNEYHAVFTNSQKSVTTTAATLTVLSAPVVTTNPMSQSIVVGSKATFTAAAAGNPAPTVQWQISTNDGATFSNISGATSATLSFTTTSGESGDEYQAVFTNSQNTAVTTPATLTVTTPPSAPTITSDPVNQNVVAGSTAAFTAAANGNPAPTVQWEISTNAGKTFANITGATSPTYTFTTTAGETADKFEAVFTNSKGHATTTAATLTVLSAPVVSTNPKTQSVNAGSKVTFTAAAGGSPAPTVQWQLSTNGGINFTNISGATSTTYSFTAAIGENGNLYQAVFTNSQNSATTTAATLTVTAAPAITTDPINQSLVAGSTATFTAAASGNPTPTVQWEISTNAGKTFTNIPGATSTIYTFTTTAAETADKFEAVFTNSKGKATTTAATLTVLSRPNVTTNPKSQSVSAGKKVTFTAAASGDPTPTVQWQVSTNSGMSFTNISGATSTTYSFTTTIGENGYQYQAVFTNSQGSTASIAAILTV